MKSPPFSYVRATSLAEAFKLWSGAGPDARLLAGGQSLLASLAFRLSEPPVLIDISRLDELRGISEKLGVVRVGALTTHAELGAHPLVQRHLPLLVEAVPLIAHPAIRNRGTIGGSLAFADPAAELPACCVAMEAQIVVASPAGERRVPAAQFFTGLYEVALGRGEMISAVEFPVARNTDRFAILEVARRSGDYAIAGLAVKARLAGTTLIDPRIACFAVGDKAVLADKAMAAIAGRAATPDNVAAAQAALDGDLDPPADLHGSAEMKRHLARVLLGRALRRIGGTEGARAA